MARRAVALPLLVVLLGMAAASRGPAGAQEIVARIGSKNVRCPTSSAEQRQACARSLLGIASADAQAAFIAKNGLGATDAEVAELTAYNAAFERHDRSQRSRKLEELDVRLATTVDAGERERLERFRAVLVRLARYEADVDAGLEERTVVPIETLRSWVESAKLNAALYARYGGTVGINAAGQYAHGAHAALVADYLAAHDAQFFDPDIERRLRAILSAAPRLMFTGAVPDFTPYWKRPIPASYVAD